MRERYSDLLLVRRKKFIVKKKKKREESFLRKACVISSRRIFFPSKIWVANFSQKKKKVANIPSSKVLNLIAYMAGSY